MSQNNDSTIIGSINTVEGFDPVPYAVDYTDLTTGETRKRLPAMIQMAWFRLKYPEGKISVEVSPGHDCFPHLMVLAAFFILGLHMLKSMWAEQLWCLG